MIAGESSPVIWVSGAASGIGEAFARLAAEKGARLGLADIDEARLNNLCNELSAAGTDCIALPADVSDEAQVANAIAQTYQHLGALHGAVNNAGITGPAAPIEDLSWDDWQRVINVSLGSVFLGLKHQLPLLKQQNRGAIVNVASGAGLIPAQHLAAYTAAKHGVLGLTKTAAQENIRSGVRINAVLPGSTRTPMMEASMAASEAVHDMVMASVPCGRLGEPQEQAEAIWWLLSDAASYVNGHSMIVDGGTLCR